MGTTDNPHSTAGRAVAIVAISVGAAVVATAIGGAVLAVIFARTVVTPPKKRDEDLRILDHTQDAISFAPSIDSLAPGLYSMWFSQDSGHARIGKILESSPTAVKRQLLGVDRGSLDGITRARIGGWYYLRPSDLELDATQVEIPTELGPAPAWFISAASPTTRWVIGVHGRAVRREETLRAVPVFREAGFNCLLVSYRNDGDAPATDDNRYSLGDTEWRDVEAALQYAIERGATEIVLMGWSMGGATVLQTVSRSPLARYVMGVVLDSPVVDWITALHFQGIAHKLPRPVRLAMFGLLSHRWSRLMTGQAHPIDFRRLNWVRRAGELDVPILLMHSVDDGYVPVTASRALAMARPDIVTFHEFDTARHTRLWNYDPGRWNRAIASWLDSLRAGSLTKPSRGPDV